MEDKLCETCNHYQRLYFKKPARLVYAGRGFCIRNHLKPKEKSMIPCVKTCADYSPQQDNRTAEREPIKRALREMRERLENISLLLADEE